jgi:hypothetical protein
MIGSLFEVARFLINHPEGRTPEDRLHVIRLLEAEIQSHAALAHREEANVLATSLRATICPKITCYGGSAWDGFSQGRPGRN